MQIRENENVETDQIPKALCHRYAAVADHPTGSFACPIAYESATQLGYGTVALDSMLPTVIDPFMGAGNPFPLSEPLWDEWVILRWPS